MNIRTGPQSSWRSRPSFINHVFFLNHVYDPVLVCRLTGEEFKSGCTKGRRTADGGRCFGQCSAGKLAVLPLMWMLLWHAPPTDQRLEGSVTDSLVPDTTTYLQRSGDVFFGVKKRAVFNIRHVVITLRLIFVWHVFWENVICKRR